MVDSKTRNCHTRPEPESRCVRVDALRQPGSKRRERGHRGHVLKSPTTTPPPPSRAWARAARRRRRDRACFRRQSVCGPPTRKSAWDCSPPPPNDLDAASSQHSASRCAPTHRWCADPQQPPRLRKWPSPAARHSGHRNRSGNDATTPTARDPRGTGTPPPPTRKTTRCEILATGHVSGRRANCGREAVRPRPPKGGL